MILGSIESDQDKVAEIIEKNSGETVGLNIVKIACDLYNGGNPGYFQGVGLQLPVDGQFRFAPDAPWSNIPSNGLLNYSALYDSKLLVNYLEINNADKFNVYFVMD